MAGGLPASPRTPRAVKAPGGCEDMYCWVDGVCAIPRLVIMLDGWTAMSRRQRLHMTLTIALLTVVAVVEIIAFASVGTRGGFEAMSLAIHGKLDKGRPASALIRQMGVDPRPGTEISLPLLQDASECPTNLVAILALGACSDCSVEPLRLWQGMKERYPDCDFAVVVQDFDVDRVQRLLTEHRITIPVFFDLDGTASSELNAFFFPRVYVVENQRVLLVQRPDEELSSCIARASDLLRTRIGDVSSASSGSDDLEVGNLEEAL